LVDYIDPTAQLNSCEASRPKNLTCQGKQLVLRKPWPDCTWACPNEYADDSKPKEPNMTFDTNGNIAYPLEVARPSSPDDLLYNAGQFYDSATGTQLASPNTSDTERLAGSAQTSPDTTSAALERLTAQVVAAAAASMAANSNSTAGTLMCKMQQVGYRRDGKCIHFDSDCPDQKPAGDGWVKGSGCTASELESSANTGMVIVTPATGADHIALPDAPNPGMLDVGPATGVYTPPHSDPNIGMVDAGDSSSSSDCSTGISGRSHGYRSDGITCQEFINECERKNLEASGFTQSC
jgi:hypothetical protein